MSIRLTILCIFALAFGYCVTADAQTVQPTYTRPSKGAALQIYNAPVATSFTNTSSAVFDWTAFSGVSVTVNRADSRTDCPKGIRVKAFGGPTVSPSTHRQLPTINGYYNTSVDDSWYVRVLTPYMQIKIDSYDSGSVGFPCTGNVTVTITPIPFDPSGPGNSTTFSVVVTPASAANATFTFQQSGETPRIRIQNLGITAGACGAVPIDGISYLFPIALTAGAALNDGNGGIVTLDGFAGKMICKNAVVGETSRFGFFAY